VKEYASEKIRNVGLIGHGGVGKTSLGEAMLFIMGETNRLGKVIEGTTISDYHPDEIERRHSISTSLMHGEWKECKINLLDMPGYSDFLGDTKGSLSVVDLAVVLINGVSGIEVGTEQVMEFADEYKCPRMFFVNRMDAEHARFDAVLKSLQDRFGNTVVVLQFPVNSGEGFNRIVDVLNQKLLTFEPTGNGKPSIGDIPENFKKQASEWRNRIIEAAAESDDKLLESYFASGELTEDQLKQGLAQGILKGCLLPVFCGSAEKNIGMAPLLDFFCDYGPKPFDVKKVSGMHPDNKEKVEWGSTSKDPLCAFVFKTLVEAHVGELSLIRVYSGQLIVGSEALNASNRQAEKIGQMYVLNGKNRKEIGVLTAGDIGALVKLRNTFTGNTLCEKKHPVMLESIHFPEPLISVAIKPKTRGDEDKISNGLHMLKNEDPSFTVLNDAELHQTILSGQGELHLTVVIKRLKERFGVEVSEERPKIPYRETITAKADEKYRHKKQSGGAGQFAEVWMKIEPLPRGTGFEFKNEVHGGHISGPFIPSIEKGVRQVLVMGPMAGHHVVDVRAIVYDGKEHPVDSKDIAFQIAGREVFKQLVLNAKPILLEPIYDIEVKVPEDCMGDVMGDLSGRRGKIMGMDTQGHFQVIKAKIPLSELDRYATTLRSKTSGRGIFTMTFSHYEPVPKELEARIVEEAKKTKEQEKEA
jgi:elongation factor G